VLWLLGNVSIPVRRDTCICIVYVHVYMWYIPFNPLIASSMGAAPPRWRRLSKEREREKERGSNAIPPVY